LYEPLVSGAWLGKGWIFRYMPEKKTYLSLGFVGWASLGWRMAELECEDKVSEYVVPFVSWSCLFRNGHRRPWCFVTQASEFPR
jgi:hypothetical protein